MCLPAFLLNLFSIGQMINRIVILFKSLLIVGFLSTFYACFQRETVYEIVPGIVRVEPLSIAPDSLIFSEVRTLPQVSILEMNNFYYRKLMTVAVDSSQFHRELMSKLPFINFLHFSSIIVSGNALYQQFNCKLINVDTADEKRWLFVLDSLGYIGYYENRYPREIKLLVPEKEELEYSSKLRKLSFVANANPELRLLDIKRSIFVK
jgi:hypothetical protein